ncbi:MAG: hypothetical protein WCJ57_02635 [Candidatus Falkowbacteria bacterium]
MKITLFFLSLILSLTSSAQDSTLNNLIQKHFPGLSIEEYLSRKIVAIHHSQYDVTMPKELIIMIESSDEIDTDLQEAIALYISDQENFSQLVKSAQTYGENFPNSKLLTEEDVAMVFRSILKNCFPIEFVSKIQTIRMREE